MDKQVVTMAVVTDKEGLVERIGHSTITHPAINYTGNGTNGLRKSRRSRRAKHYDESI